MPQNRSHAVMAQRSEPHDSLDDFPTPPWATRALIEKVLWLQDAFDPRGHYRGMSVWEPACNRGYMVRPLREYFGSVTASDVHDYGLPEAWQADFLFPASLPASLGRERPDWIITNPPFRLAEQFIYQSSRIATDGFAMLVRTSFLEGVQRWERLFSRNPPSIVAQFAERVPMFRGRIDPNGSTATSYCWLVWIVGHERTDMVWIPPCRRFLEKEGDYA